MTAAPWEPGEPDAEAGEWSWAIEQPDLADPFSVRLTFLTGDGDISVPLDPDFITELRHHLGLVLARQLDLPEPAPAAALNPDVAPALPHQASLAPTEAAADPTADTGTAPGTNPEAAASTAPSERTPYPHRLRILAAIAALTLLLIALGSFAT